MISERVQAISMSPTARVAAAANRMRQEGVDVYDFSVGEPDFPTPSNIKEAARRAIDADFTKYTANDGICELREAICGKLKTDNGIEVLADEVLVSAGAKASIYFAVTALLNEGDSMLIPAPHWVSYPDMARLCRASPVIIGTQEQDGFKLCPRNLDAAITDNTKVLVLNYPSNPCGTTYTRDELKDIADICVRRNVYVVADEVYEKIAFDRFPFVSIASLNDAIKARTVTVNGFSKAYSMTGWRMGYAAGPKEIIRAMSKVQSHATSNPNSIAQKAALEALTGPQDEIQRMVDEFQRRRDHIIQALQAIPDVTCYRPNGAFYAFPNVKKFLHRRHRATPMRSTWDLAHYLLAEAHVAVGPGDAFGMEGFLRISFATGMDRLQEGAKRIRRALLQLDSGNRHDP